ncbi:MAG: tetratricopeptide repeat protein [Deltaproteobacteria bacterium]|nr:tetratricopeptide repeat protein [Deltaproteobacteria bacterium]
MRKLFVLGIIFSFIVFLAPGSLMAQDYLAEGDAYFEKGGVENYGKAIEAYGKALEQDPESFEANWRMARAYRWYGEQSKRDNVTDWEDICAKYGKEGMKYAAKAIDLDPEKPEGYFWYGTNVGVYSDGVSILTALKEGLKDKTQESFEKVYAMDKEFEEAGAVLALGRFWSVLPWPLRDREKAIVYFEEFEQYYPEKPDYLVYYAETLIGEGGKENKAKAKELLDKAVNADEKWWSDWAKRLMGDL